MARWIAPLFAALVLALPAQGQTLRSVVVPGDAAVVVAPRGRLPPTQPRAALPPLSSYMPAGPMAAPAGMNLGAAIPMLIPLAAAVLLGASTPGASGGAAAPSTTR